MDILSSDINLSRWVIVSIGMIFMMGSLALLANKIGPIGNGTLKRNNRKKKRIKVVETLHLDGRNRIAIIQVDDVEHTVMMGQNGELHLYSQDAPNGETTEKEAEEEAPSIGFLKEIEGEQKAAETPSKKHKKGKKKKKK